MLKQAVARLWTQVWSTVISDVGAGDVGALVQREDAHDAPDRAPVGDDRGARPVPGRGLRRSDAALGDRGFLDAGAGAEAGFGSDPRPDLGGVSVRAGSRSTDAYAARHLSSAAVFLRRALRVLSVQLPQCRSPRRGRGPRRVQRGICLSAFRPAGRTRRFPAHADRGRRPGGARARGAGRRLDPEACRYCIGPPRSARCACWRSSAAVSLLACVTAVGAHRISSCARDCGTA